LTGIHHRQAVQQENPELGHNHVSPGSREFITRRFFFKNPKSTQKRWVAWRPITTHQVVSGKIPRNVNFIHFRQFICIHSS